LALGFQEGANVGSGLLYSDGEARVGGDVERAASSGGDRFGGAVDDVGGFARDDVHAFGGFGTEVIFAREDDAESFAFASGGDDGVRDDFSVEVEIGFGVGSDVSEFHVRKLSTNGHE